MNCPAAWPPQRTSRSLLAACLCAVLAAAGGCSGGGDNSGASSGLQADDDFLFTVNAALSEGQLTLNNRWIQADLDHENIGAAISYEGLNQPAGRVRAYTTLVQEYRVRRQQCEEDFNKFYPEFEYKSPASGVIYLITDRKCYPTLTDLPYSFRRKDGYPRSPLDNPILKRYGYYSGGGFPPVPPSDTSRFRNGTPEPLDPVDYCSRLHDQKVWAGDVNPILNHSNECGILMCLYKASGLPANVMALLPDVEASRQHWYDGAASACAGNQSDNAPPPVLGP